MLALKPFYQNHSSRIFFKPFSSFKSDPLPELSYYKNKRIYKDRSKFNLMNQLLINELCRHEIFVRNSMSLYNLARKCLGFLYTLIYKE